MKTKILGVTLLLVSAFLSACGGGETPAPEAVVEEPAPVEEVIEEEPTEPVEETVEEPAEEPPATGPFTIVAEESEARFLVNEVLNGANKTVIGTTNAVSGEVVADLTDPASASTNVTVDLSGLATDNNFRNRSIREMILQTNNADYQFAEFVSTGVEGMPASVAPGDTVEFQLTGNLTIHGVTQPVTFSASVTVIDDTRLEGTASLEIRYADFDVTILRLPEQVASVESRVILEIDFVATR